MKKVLINTPDFRNKGGVAQYYIVMNFQTENGINYFNINNFGSNAIWRLLDTYKKFNREISSYDTVVLNPSLDKKSFLRDAAFVWLSLKKNKMVIVFWHGWNSNFEKQLISSFFLKKIFRKTYAKAFKTIVLSKIFQDKLIEFGALSKFYVEAMPVPQEWINMFDISSKKISQQLNVVFLSRIIKEKGVYTAVNAIRLLIEGYPNIFLHIAGDGKDLSDLKKYVEANKISNVIFYGDVRGKKKIEILSNGNIFLFPTQHGEGFPNVVIEAMFYGMPVISRYVGAIPEIIEQDVTGYLTESVEPKAYASIIERYLSLSDSEKMQMAINCHNKSKSNYNISAMRKRVLKIFQES
jgi:glycosyltransferase involved in cell wall biosynthesis